MAKIIEFYVPQNYQPKKIVWTPPELRGKVIEFQLATVKKSA